MFLLVTIISFWVHYNGPQVYNIYYKSSRSSLIEFIQRALSLSCDILSSRHTNILMAKVYSLFYTSLQFNFYNIKNHILFYKK